MPKELITEMINKLIPILPTLLSVFIGALLGFISTFLLDCKKAWREKKQYNRTKKEDAYLDCISLLILINTNKQEAFGNINSIIRTRSKIDLYGSKQVREDFRNIADNILNDREKDNEEVLTKLIEKMREELEIKD